MAWVRTISRRLRGRTFRKDEDGAVLVEFGIVFPVMLLMLMLMIEAGRMLWAYQIAVEGVREAGRYLARVAPVDICQTGGSVAGFATNMTDIFTNNSAGDPFFDEFITVNSVTPGHTCVPGGTGTEFRVDPAPVGTVTAVITIDFPFTGIMGYFGQDMTSVQAVIRDQFRIFGQ